MEALGTAVGVASLGIQVCQGLLSYYDGWKDYNTDIRSTHQGIAALTKTFALLETSLTESTTKSKSNDKETLAGRTVVVSHLKACDKGVDQLRKKLCKLQSHEEPQGLRQKTWAEMQRAWYPFRASTLAKLREMVGEQRDGLSLALQTLQQITLDQGISELLSNQQAAENKISDVLLGQQAAKHRAIIDWLSPPDPYANHNAARQKHEPDTGSWLLRSDKYLHWKSSATNMLWLTGKAGCGKTVLSSTVIEDLRALPDTRLAFFYFSFSDTQKQSYAGLLASLIAQLSHSKAAPALDKLQQVYDKIHPSKPSTETLEDTLLACLQQPGQTALVLDALDELPEDSSTGRPAVLQWLGRIIQANTRTKIFLTSRQLSDIQESITSFGACYVILQPELANHDIRKYVATALENHPRLCKCHVNTKETIKEVFEKKADGMFRWAFCQLEMLKGLKSTKPKYIEEALYSLPDTLDETYKRMLLRIDRMYQNEALTALRWLVFETRPLTLAELAEACLIDCTGEELVDVNNRGGMEDILEILSGLVVVENTHPNSDDGDGDSDNGADFGLGPSHLQGLTSRLRVRLAHFSVKEYLLSSRVMNSEAAQFSLNQEDDYPVLAQSCLAYVLYYSQSTSKTMSDRDLEMYPLLRYAAETWPTFIKNHDQAQPAHQIQLLESKQHRQNWLAIYRPDISWKEPFSRKYREESGSGLYYASFIGLTDTCQTLLDRGADINAQGGEYSNALQAASLEGHQQVVQLLLDKGVEVNARGGYYGNALQAAIAEGHQQVAQLLLDKDADVNAKVGYYGNALQAASLLGDQQVVQLLLDKGVDINARGGVYSNALQAALVNGHQQVVQLLLDNGAEVNAQGGEYNDALQAASARGHQQVVQLLLDKGVDINARGGLYGNALQAASARGHQSVVQLLLDKGADVNAQGGIYGNALQAASERGHQEVVQLLQNAAIQSA